MNMNNRIVIIAGGTAGIGYATALKMAREGAVVYAAARHEIAFEQCNIHYHYLDVTDVSSCEKLFLDVINEHGRIDSLIVDAGITADALTSKMTDDQFDKVIDVNIKGLFNMVRFVGPYMEKQGWGSIVTVSSIVGIEGNIGQINYSASKGAIISMTKTWAKEFSRKGSNVRVNTVAPGFIMTRMMNTIPDHLLSQFAEKTMLKRLGRAEEVAGAIAFLSSDAASYITGAVINVDGGMRL